jgi:hypothetical protein
VKKLNHILVVFVIAAFVLAACSPSSSQGTEYPGFTEMPGSTESLETPEMTEPVTTPEMTESVATAESTMPAEPTAQATEPAATEAIPPTGAIDPGRVSNLLDFGVFSQDGAQIGDVEDIILDFGEAYVDYVVVNANGKTVPVPWDAVEVVSAQAQSKTSGTPAASSGPQNDFILKVDQSAFDGAPEYDLTTLPALGENAEGWDSELASYWQGVLGAAGGTPAVSATETPAAIPETPSSGESMANMSGIQGVALASKLIGASVTVGGSQVTVDDILIDSVSGDIKYVVFSLSSGSSGETLIPVPLGVLGWDPSTQSFTVTTDLTTLSGAPTFTAESFPDTLQSDWDTEISSYWEQFVQTTPTQ